ncbi:MAG: ComF family protein [Bacteroidaceae bacterium]|nr:ComF family protein [Bacteroidaceae bacterium]
MNLSLFCRSALDFFFPRTCVVCGTRLASSEQFICPMCLISLPIETVETDWQLNRHIMRWRSEHPSLQRMGALCIYQRENAAAKLVHEVKFARNHELGIWMGRLAARRLASTELFEGVDALVPLPLSPKRLRKRGFNQAEALAQGISEVSGIPVRTDLLRRTAERESQTHYRLAERFRNGQGLFTLAADSVAPGSHLMLVDDVLTTGSTMMSAVAALEPLSDIRLSCFAWAWVDMSPEVWSRARREAGM